MSERMVVCVPGSQNTLWTTVTLPAGSVAVTVAMSGLPLVGSLGRDTRKILVPGVLGARLNGVLWALETTPVIDSPSVTFELLSETNTATSNGWPGINCSF